MSLRKAAIASVLFSFLSLLAGFANGQVGAPKPGDGSPTQRLEIMRSRLEAMRRSVEGAMSALKTENKEDKTKKDDKDKLDTPLGRLTSLQKEISSTLSEVNNLRGKVDRGEKYEVSDIDQLENTTAELNTRTESTLVETATARANPESSVGKERDIKKKKKFLGIFGGGGNDEYDELIGNVTPGRDR